MKSIKEVLSSKRGRIGFTIVVLVLGVLLFSSIQKCHAEGLGVSVAKEVTHDEATIAGFVDYTAPSWSVYVGQWDSAQFTKDRNMVVVGAEYRAHLGPIFAGLGVAHLNQLTALNGTKDNFSLTIGYSSSFGDLFCRHFSHASMFGIEPDKANGGWNLCGGRWGF
jgi:hypothetical protein